MSILSKVKFTNYQAAVTKALDLIDAVGSSLLGHNPQKIEYLKLSNGLLGSMDDVEIIEA